MKPNRGYVKRIRSYCRVMWRHDVTDDFSCAFPISEISVGDYVVRALTRNQLLREQRRYRKFGYRVCGNVATGMHYPTNSYLVTEITENGGVKLYGFCGTVSAKYLRKVPKEYAPAELRIEPTGWNAYLYFRSIV